MRQLFGSGPRTGAGELDYVACWFELLGLYIDKNRRVAGAFVSTNSITQGEQVYPLWSRMLVQHRLRIFFAHRTFEWDSEARGKAHVHVVIIGVETREADRAPRLFDYETPKSVASEWKARNINPYLVDATDIIVKKRSSPITPRPLIRKGSEATDFGFLTVSSAERSLLLHSNGFQPKWLRPFIGGDEYI